jgi:ABC-type glycerol-3-phosphate transport system substrate-binding protein
MKRMLTMAIAAALVLAACGDGSPTTTGPDAQQVPPVDADPVFIDSWDIGTGEVTIRGDAPTPCHEVGWFVEETDTVIEVTVWSEAGDEACAQVLEPFEISVSFEAPSTEVPVLINGQEAGRVG